MHSGLRFISWLSLVYLFFVLSSGKPEKISNCLHHFAATNFLLYFNSSNRITWHESYLNNESCHETFQKAIKKQKSKINKRIGTRTRDSEAQITFEAVACWQNLQPWPVCLSVCLSVSLSASAHVFRLLIQTFNLAYTTAKPISPFLTHRFPRWAQRTLKPQPTSAPSLLISETSFNLLI